MGPLPSLVCRSDRCRSSIQPTPSGLTEKLTFAGSIFLPAPPTPSHSPPRGGEELLRVLIRVLYSPNGLLEKKPTSSRLLQLCIPRQEIFSTLTTDPKDSSLVKRFVPTHQANACSNGPASPPVSTSTCLISILPATF